LLINTHYVPIICWFGPKFSLTGNKFQSNIKRGRKKIDENNGKEKVPKKSEKMPKY
jgi:hypothetical protein